MGFFTVLLPIKFLSLSVIVIVYSVQSAMIFLSGRWEIKIIISPLSFLSRRFDMNVMARFQNRRSRIIVFSKNQKEHVVTRRTRKETLELFDNIVIKAGDKVVLQDYVEDHGWVDQETKKYKPPKVLV